jgi:hypothetical protein
MTQAQTILANLFSKLAITLHGVRTVINWPLAHPTKKEMHGMKQIMTRERLVDEIRKLEDRPDSERLFKEVAKLKDRSDTKRLIEAVVEIKERPYVKRLIEQTRKLNFWKRSE